MITSMPDLEDILKTVAIYSLAISGRISSQGGGDRGER